MKKFFVDPDQVLHDLSVLSKSCHPQHIRLLGGEPLLHPRLLDVIEAVRESGISECIRVVTNGTLLDRMPEAFWKNVDQIHISLYPESGVSSRKIATFRQKARAYRTQLEVRSVRRFRRSFAESGTDNLRLQKRIFQTCRIAQTWRCQTVHNGYFYRCSPSVMIPLFLKHRFSKPVEMDGLKLSGSRSFAGELFQFLERDEPLAACGYCLGTIGKRYRLGNSVDGFTSVPFSAESGIDWKRLLFYEVIGNQPIPSFLQKRALSSKTFFTKRNH